MRVILALMWGVALFAFWTAPEGWTADEKQAGKGAKNWPWKVKGLATDLARAKQDALDKARERIIAELRHCRPPILAWRPSSEFIQDSLVAKAQVNEGVIEGVPTTYCTLELKPPDWERFYNLDQEEQKVQQHQRGEARMVLLAKVLAGVMLLLFAAIAYVRLDDWTQGYYTRWLQIAGASLIVGLGTGLWLFR
jgi:hypothetical protein